MEQADDDVPKETWVVVDLAELFGLSPERTLQRTFRGT